MRQLFEPMLHEASAAERDDLLQGPARLAARVLGLPGALEEGEAPAAAPDASFAVLHGLYWLCANLAADQLVVLSVDDAHWADASSLRFLAFLHARACRSCGSRCSSPRGPRPRSRRRTCWRPSPPTRTPTWCTRRR